MVDLNVSGNIEKRYQKKTQLEHILIRPDTYVGSIKSETQMMWIYDAETDSMIEKKVTYNPALYKIFDEIIVNASDHKIVDKKMSCIRININKSNNEIRVWNNGRGIPVTVHKEEKVYVPTMIFGHLLTSTNFDDTEKKVTGGRNGYGAKLCNIFSTEFSVETSSKKYNHRFKQTWRNNMHLAEDPVISEAAESDFTVVSFKPDLAKFHMESLDDDIIGLFSRRAFDIAACTSGVTVYLNNKVVPVKTFKDYVDLYTKNAVDYNEEPLKVVHEKFDERWEVAVTTSTNDTFTQISFVNSIATTKGGSHVNLVTDQLCSKLLEMAKKKLKTDKQAVKLKSAQVKMNLWVFVRCLIENPSFDSQTKENMTLNSKDFGSTVSLSDKFMNSVAKCGVMEKMTMWATMKNQALMDKKCSKSKHSKLKNIPKLDDANDAGGKNSLYCTLILTEGDSAKTLAVAGLSVIGRDRYGVFPLRGKLLNVREASSKQLLENQELSNLIKILGLRYTEKYPTSESMKTLRYGKILIMTDQDQDGSHIKGLVINFIHTHWPNLLKHNFVEEFITPIVKATRRNESICFYSIPELTEWLKNTPDSKKFSLKYYKGLGTSTSKEAKEYFSDMTRHLIKFSYSGVSDDKSILLAFGKNKADERKEWLTNYMEGIRNRRELGQPEEFLYGPNTRSISFNEFINKELILFSNTDNIRSIPCLVDGMKPGQRKVLFTCLKRNLNKELKVAQLAGSVAEISCYHHGEVSLMGTIINLAQDYVGSNNINLLMPGGQFGTRLSGGKDSASPRYIFTRLNPLTRLIFHPQDDAVLKYEYDDNQRIEPEYYVPIIPTVLVNGADGIGTGWSTKVPNFNPKDIIDNLRRKINGEPIKKMKPWYRGFRGTVQEVGDNKFVASGEIGLLDNNCLEITELPVKTWTQNYKENVMEVYLNGTEKVPAVITDYKEYNTDVTVRFVVEMNSNKFKEAEELGLHKFFKLNSNLTSSNMVLFDEFGVIRRFNCAEEILENFYKVRIARYGQRKKYLVGLLSAEASKLENQARFILEKISDVLKIEDRKLKDINATLKERNYDSDPIKAWKKNIEDIEAIEDTNDATATQEEEEDANKPDYTYLTSMAIHQLSREKKESLLAERDKKLAELIAVKNKTEDEMWLDDLDALEKAMKEQEEETKTASEFKPKELVKTDKKGRGNKKIKLDAETAPSKFSIRVEPKIEEELTKKMLNENTKKKQQKMMADFVNPRKSTEGTSTTGAGDNDEPLPFFKRMAAEGIDTSGLLDKKSAPKVNGAPKEKKAKRNISPKKKKKNPWDSDSEIDDNMDHFDEDMDQPDDDIIPRDAPTRVKKNVNYSLDDAFEDSPQAEVQNAPICIDDDSDFDPAAEKDDPKKTSSSESRKNPEPSTTNTNNKNDKPIKTLKSKDDTKPKVARKRTIPPKNTKDQPKEKKSKPAAKPKEKPTAKKAASNKKKVFSSDEDDADDMFKPQISESDEDVIKKEKPTRVRATVKKYKISSSEGESDQEQFKPNVNDDDDDSDFM